MNRVINLVLMLCLAAVSCKQWRVSSLKSKQFSFINNGTEPDSVKINTDNYALESLTFGLGVYYGLITVTDNLLKRVQVLEPDGSIRLIIGTIEGIDQKKVKSVFFNFNIIGSFAMDSDENIYVQNRFPQPKIEVPERPGISPPAVKIDESSNEEINFSPSYILVFNIEGKLQYTLGQQGTPDIPFYYIEYLHIDKKGRLFVISRSFNTWSVFRFDKRKRDFFADLSKLEFKETEGKDEFKGKIENIKIYNSGEKLLISVAFYHELRLKYRKIYEYDIGETAVNRTIMNIPDPRNVLFNIVDDKHIYFWNMDGKDVKFMISNMEGNIINNIHLKINKGKTYYSKILTDQTGKIYTYHVTRKGINIFAWE